MLARTFVRRFPVNTRSFGAIADNKPVAAGDAHKASVLANGVQIVSNDKASNLLSLKFVVLGGSSAENEDEKGAAHLLSVAAFAGTTTKSGLRVMREFEDMGASVSASADREKISVDVKVISSMAELAFQRLAEVVTSPPKNPTVVLDDCKSAAQLAYTALQENPNKLLAELLHEAAFGEESPMGSTLLGTYGLDHVSIDQVTKYRQRQFLPNNFLIACTGIRHEELKQLTEKYLSSAVGKATPVSDSPYTGGHVKHRADLHGHTYLALAFPTPASGSAKSFKVLTALLNRKLSKNTGLTSFYAPYTKTGLWGFYANGSSSSAANALLESAVNELKTISNGNVDAADVEAAKTQVGVTESAKLESDCVAGTLVSAYLAKSSPSEYVNYNSVSGVDVVNAARSSLGAAPAYVTLGKTHGAASFATVNGWLKTK